MFARTFLISKPHLSCKAIQHNKRSTASLAAVELSSEGVEEDNGGRGKAPMCTSHDISMRQLLFIWPFCKALPDLTFTSSLWSSEWLSFATANCYLQGKVCIRNSPRPSGRKIWFVKMFLIRVLSFKAELVLTTESIQQWVWTDRKWGETQQQMKQHLLD